MKRHWKALMGWWFDDSSPGLKFPVQVRPASSASLSCFPKPLLLRISQFTVVLVADLMWTRLVAYHFLLGRCYFLFTLCYWACASFRSEVCGGEVKRWKCVNCYVVYRHRPIMIYHAHLVARSSVWHDLVGDLNVFFNWYATFGIRKHSRVWLWYELVGAFSVLSCSGTNFGKPPATSSPIEITNSQDRKVQVSIKNGWSCVIWIL